MASTMKEILELALRVSGGGEAAELAKAIAGIGDSAGVSAEEAGGLAKELGELQRASRLAREFREIEAALELTNKDLAKAEEGYRALNREFDGTAKRIVKPGQVFSRIHVDDIAAVLAASMARPRPGAAYNVCDDEPAPPQDVVAYAAHLLGREPPPEIAFADAELSPMARSFYEESKRVSNRLIHEELGVALLYPTYREGLKALLAAEARPSPKHF